MFHFRSNILDSLDNLVRSTQTTERALLERDYQAPIFLTHMPVLLAIVAGLGSRRADIIISSLRTIAGDLRNNHILITSEHIG